MQLLLTLPVTTFISFFIALLMILIRSRGKNPRYTLLYVFMNGTGLIFSLIEYILLFNRYGWDDSALKRMIAVFILAVAVNSLNCIGKGIVVYKGYSDDKTDYTGITGKLNMFDPICLLVLIAVVLVFK